MSITTLGAIFMVGLVGGMHCAGMCGGIVAALSAGQPGTRAPWSLHLAFNAGRILVYCVAGAAAGAAGSMAMFLNDVLPIQLAMYLLANLMLVGLGLYLFGITRYVAAVERVGALAWRLMRPLAGRFLPARTWPRALGLGLLWGWIPCGLVYSMLATALLAGAAFDGALVMLAFGLGTLPNLLLAGALMRALSRSRNGRAVRNRGREHRAGPGAVWYRPRRLGGAGRGVGVFLPDAALRQRWRGHAGRARAALSCVALRRFSKRGMRTAGACESQRARASAGQVLRRQPLR